MNEQPIAFQLPYHVCHCSLISHAIHGTSTTFAFSISVRLSWIQDSIYEYSIDVISKSVKTTSENPLPKTKIIVNNSHTRKSAEQQLGISIFFPLLSLSHSCTFDASRFVCIVQTLSPSDTLLIYISLLNYNNSEQIDFICFCLPLKWHFVISIKHLW